MHKGRTEAFSDGVLAIIITIMVLELHVPHEKTLAGLVPLVPTLGSYLLSFIFVGIYWNNHHHLWQAVKQVNGAVLWANIHLLFWLSLIPFCTRWLGDSHFAPVPAACYGVTLIGAGFAFTILTRVLMALHGPDSTLARAMGSDFKGKISLLIYAIAIPLAFVRGWLACVLYLVVALIWLVPDRRMERALGRET